MVCVEPATKNFVAFTNGTNYTVSAWEAQFNIFFWTLSQNARGIRFNSHPGS